MKRKDSVYAFSRSRDSLKVKTSAGGPHIVGRKVNIDRASRSFSSSLTFDCDVEDLERLAKESHEC
jgi:hypothetical protein